MRLIDADAFEVFTYTHRNNDFDDGVQYVLEAIDNAPTIEPDVPGTNVGDMISRQAAIDALKRDEEYDEDIPNRADGVRDAIITIMGLPSATLELSDEDMRLFKKLRSYHNGSYAKLLDKMMASAQPSLKEAVETIRRFLDNGIFTYTSEFKTKDGKLLHTDWGYFEEGLDEIEIYIEGKEETDETD